MDMVEIRVILVAIDFSDISATVMDYAQSLAAAWQARLLVVHVVYDLSFFTGIYFTDTPLPELQQRLEAEARERLRRPVKPPSTRHSPMRPSLSPGVLWQRFSACPKSTMLIVRCGEPIALTSQSTSSLGVLRSGCSTRRLVQCFSFHPGNRQNLSRKDSLNVPLPRH